MNCKKIMVALGTAGALLFTGIASVASVVAEGQDTEQRLSDASETSLKQSTLPEQSLDTSTVSKLPSDAPETPQNSLENSQSGSVSETDQQQSTGVEEVQENVPEASQSEPVVEPLAQETINHLASLLGLDGNTTEAYSISMEGDNGEQLKSVKEASTVTVPTDTEEPQKELWIFHLLDSPEAVQEAFENNKMYLGTTTVDDAQMLDEINACDEFMAQTGYEDEDGNKAGNRNVFAYTIMTEADNEVQLSDDSVTFETTSFSNFVFSWNNISNTWRAGGQPLANYVNGSVGSVPVKANAAISAYYNFKLGGDTSAKQLGYANWAWYGNNNAGGYGGWTTANMTNNGILTSYVYDVSGFASETPIGTGQIYCTYPSIGKYNGKEVDARLSVTKFGRNATESGAKPPLIGFSKDTIAVNVLGIDYVEVTYEFFEAGTNTSISVKGNTTYTDIDYLQGIMIHNSCDGIYVSTTDPYPLMESVYASAVDGVPYVYDNADVSWDGNSYKDADSKKAAFTEIFSGSSITRTYTFARRADRLGRGGIANETQTVNLPANGAILRIKKVLKGANNDDEFNFSVRIADQTGRAATEGRYGAVTIGANGEGSFQLKGGESTTIEGLYPSYTVTVTEQDDPDYAVLTNGQNTKSYIYHVTDSMELEEVEFVNTFIPHNLTVEKIVTGNMGNKDQSFDFTLQLTDRFKGKEISTTGGAVLKAGENGIVNFSLKHKDSITFTGLSTADIAGLKQKEHYGVAENPAYKQQGYYTKYDVNDSDSTGIVITVTNDKSAGVPTVVPSDNKSAMTIVLGIAGFITCIAVHMYCRKYINN